MIMVVKNLKCLFSLFSYSNLCDQFPDLYCHPVLTYTAYVIVSYLTPDY